MKKIYETTIINTGGRAGEVQVSRKKIQQIQNNYLQRLTVLALTVH